MNPIFDNNNYETGISRAFPARSPEFFNFGYDVIDRWGKYNSSKPAMIWANPEGDEKRYTFGELSELSNQSANFLLNNGFKRGDRIFVILPRLPEWWILSLAMIKIDVVQCPSPTLLTPTDLEHRINCGDFVAVIADHDNAPKFDDILANCPKLKTKIIVNGKHDGWIDYNLDIIANLPKDSVVSPEPIKTNANDPMIMMFTSGTSKHPKMVQHTHSYPLGHRVTAELWHGLTERDVHISVSDTGWAKNLWGNYFGQWIVGCCVLIFDARGKFSAADLLHALEKYEVSSFCAPPTVYRMLILEDLTKYDFKSLRSCTAAGEPLHSETMRIWSDAVGIMIREGYGQTETTCVIATTPGMRFKPGSMGDALPGWVVELHDDKGCIVPEGDEGRIAIKINPRPVGLFAGYACQDEENGKVFTENFYYTGDKAFRDTDGIFWFIGRDDDIIKSSGYRIGPSEVEEVIMQHDAVQEVAVVGAPDPLRGANVKAYIVLASGYEPSDELVSGIQQHVKDLTAPYKYPREIEFVNRMPKTFSGKIKRDLLRLHASTGEGDWDNE